MEKITITWKFWDYKNIGRSNKHPGRKSKGFTYKGTIIRLFIINRRG